MGATEVGATEVGATGVGATGVGATGAGGTGAVTAAVGGSVAATVACSALTTWSQKFNGQPARTT
ncbi:MAG: hypothetical protein EKK62_05975 [Acidimicrobiia bacterium]|nr:MAG: hypothetical protein EKK62_05975 [Acidimicrobiia bacterium]